MNYWARTQHTGIGEDSLLKGHIHHNFNSPPDHWTPEAHFLCQWDDYLRKDYWFEPVNAYDPVPQIMFIFGVYELMLSTGNRDSLMQIWPHVKDAGEQLLKLCVIEKAHIPIFDHSGYMDPPPITIPFEGGITLAAYLAMAEMATFTGDSSTITKYKQ